MGVYESVKDVISIVQKFDNIDLNRQLLDIGSQALELQEENKRLKSENDELKKCRIVEEKIVRHEQPFITIEGDDNAIKYCSRCWDVDRKLVQVECRQNGYFTCHNCENNGIYDEHKQHINYESIAF